MGQTSWDSWNCDHCGRPFAPTRNQRSRRKETKLVSCGAGECRSEIIRRVRLDQERTKHGEFVDHDSEPYVPLKWSGDLSGRKRFLVVSDIHAPFEHEDALDRALAEDADICVVNGDLSDSYSFSTFVKYEDVGWSEEWSAVEAIAKRLGKFPLVYLIAGNHDARMSKRLSEVITPQHAAWIREKVGVLDPLDVLARDYPNIQIAEREVDGNRIGWFDQIGDVIFSHAEEYSGAETNLVARKVDTYFHNHATVHGLDPYRLIIQGHTHDLSWNLIGGSRLVVQSGCLCRFHGYQLNGRRLPNRPQQLGYVTFDMNDGRVDLSTVHPHLIEP